MLGAVGALPVIYTELEISFFLLRRLLGVRTEGDRKGAKVSLCLSYQAIFSLSTRWKIRHVVSLFDSNSSQVLYCYRRIYS